MYRFTKPGNQNKKFYRLNQFIPATTLRVLDDTGKQIGLFTKDEAIRKAREQGLDLVEIAANARPPVAKIIDFKKFKYLEAKKEKENKKNARDVQTKEIRLGPFTGDHDLEVKVKRAEKFLGGGDRLKVVVKFTGRELAHREFGYAILKKFSELIINTAESQTLPKWEGRMLTQIFAPVKKNAKNEDQKGSVQKV